MDVIVAQLATLCNRRVAQQSTKDVTKVATLFQFVLFQGLRRLFGGMLLPAWLLPAGPLPLTYPERTGSASRRRGAGTAILARNGKAGLGSSDVAR